MLLINKTLIKLAKGLWGWVIAIVAFRFASLLAITTFAGQISGFLGSIYSPDLTASKAWAAIGHALLTSALMFASELLRGEMEYRCTAKARVLLRDRIFSKVVELDAGRIEKLGPVSAITASVDAVESMQVYYSQYLPGLIYCLFSPFYLFWRLQRVSFPVALFMGITALLLLPLNNLFRKAIDSKKKGYWGSMEGLAAYYLESLQGLSTIKLFSREEDRTRVLREKAFDLNNWIMEFMSINFTSFIMTEGLINAAIAGGVLIGAHQLMTGRIGFDAAMLLLMLGYSFFNAFRELLSATHSALTGVAAVDKVEKVLAIDTSRPYDKNAPKDPECFSGIRLDHVSHSYEGRDTTLTDVSLRAERGKTTALVGLSGCGKSTSAALMMKFFDPASGKLYIDRDDYISLTPEELRKRIIMVPQSVSIFSGSIRDNLLMADPEATDAEMLEALDEVSLGDWVRSQPEGLDTDTGDSGARLSGGQRQKIGIARALLRKAEYIIFDEATSLVDEESEQEIWACIGRLAMSRTLIIISHRLSTIRNADRIYVLEAGRVSQSGSHKELMEAGGLYRQLVEEQSRLEESAISYTGNRSADRGQK